MALPITQSDIETLSVDHRMELVQAIWDSIGCEAGNRSVSQSHLDEIARRLSADEAEPDSGSSWEEVKTRIAFRREIRT